MGMASENACALQSRENIFFFQNKTLLVMFYRHKKHFGTNFVILNIFLKQKIVKTRQFSLASSYVEFSIGLPCNPVWDWDKQVYLEFIFPTETLQNI